MNNSNEVKIILENYELVPRTVRIKGEDEYLFLVNHSADYKRTKKDADEIAKIIVNRVNEYDNLIEINKELLTALKDMMQDFDNFEQQEKAYNKAQKILSQIEQNKH